MNKYIIPICDIYKSKIYNEVIVANSVNECKEKLMDKFEVYYDVHDYNVFINEMDDKDILIGKITDIETIGVV